MKLAFFIAKRYLFAKKSTNAINIISGISTLGVFIGTAALVIILSVFNGFEGLVVSLYNKFSPDIKIESTVGKSFDPNTSNIQTVLQSDVVLHAVFVLEEKVLLRYNDNQYIATLKGMSQEYESIGKLDSAISQGRNVLRVGEQDFAVLGTGVAYRLGVFIDTAYEPIQFFAPKKTARISINPADEFNQDAIYASGIFQVQQEFDDKYVLVPLRFARNLLDEEVNISSIEISLKSDAEVAKFKQMSTEVLGKDFSVKNRYEQDELLYKILNSEKWAVYLILTFVLIIAICNIIGSLTMLVIDKKKDIAVLLSMGAENGLIKRIFLLEGMMISMIGAISGLVIGAAFCWLQIKYGFISISGAETLSISAYPMEMKWTDFILVFATVLAISFIASWLSANLSVRHSGKLKDELSVQ